MTAPGRILLVEDHDNISKPLADFLHQEGYMAILADSLKSARERLAEQPDLIVLDWMLPDGQGIDFLRDLRAQGNATPIIFLSARAELLDKVLGLEMGANDYMTKPFESRELLARIRSVLRTTQRIPAAVPEQPSSGLKIGSLAIDRSQRSVDFAGKSVVLVNKEFELLMLLADQPKKVFSREEILNKVWGFENFPTTRTVDTHVLWLRQKIDPEIIETVRSVGYRLGLDRLQK